MNENEQRIAIAQACGWIWDLRDDKKTYWLNKAEPFKAYPEPPDYLHSLDAMAKAIEFLTTGERMDYRDTLWECGDPLFASAADQAMAFLKAKGLWKE